MKVHKVIEAHLPWSYSSPLPKKKKNRKKNKIQYCKYCGDLITKENHYTAEVCASPECKKQKLVLCAEDCFNCKYEDCRIVKND